MGEGLLAQAVVRQATKGYQHHPQLFRFRAPSSLVWFIAEYLKAVHAEAVKRGYRFDATRVAPGCTAGRIDVPARPDGLRVASSEQDAQGGRPEWLAGQAAPLPRAHPPLWVVPGGVADWERE